MRAKQSLDKNQSPRPPIFSKTNNIIEQSQLQEISKSIQQKKTIMNNAGFKEKQPHHDNSMGSQQGNQQKQLEEGNQNIMREFATAWKSESGFSILLIEKLSLIVNNYFRMIGEIAQRNEQMQILIVYNKSLIEILNKFEDQQRKILQKLRTIQEFNIKIMKELCALKKRQFFQPQLKPQQSIFAKFSLRDLKFQPPTKDQIQQDETYKKKLLQLFKNYLLQKNDHYLPIVEQKLQDTYPIVKQKPKLLLQNYIEDLQQLHKDIIDYNKGLLLVDCNNMFDLYEMKCSIKTQMKNLNLQLTAINQLEQKKQKQFVDSVLKIQAGLSQMNENQLQTYLRKEKQVRKKIKKQRLKEQQAFIRTCEHVQNENNQLKKDIEQMRQKNNSLLEQVQRLKAKLQFKNWRKNKSGSADQSVIIGFQESETKVMKRMKALQQEIQKIKQENTAYIKQIQQKRRLEVQNEAKRRLIIQTVKDYNIILQSNDSMIRNMEVLVQYCIKKSSRKQLTSSDNLKEEKIEQKKQGEKHVCDELQNQQKQRKKEKDQFNKKNYELRLQNFQLIKKIELIQNSLSQNKQKMEEMEKDIKIKELKFEEDNKQRSKLQKQLEQKNSEKMVRENQLKKQTKKQREKNNKLLQQIQILKIQIEKMDNQNKQLLFYSQCAENLSEKFMKAFQVLIRQDITSQRYLSTLDNLFQKLKNYVSDYMRQTKKQKNSLKSITLLNRNDLNSEQLNVLTRENKSVKTKQFADIGVNVTLNLIEVQGREGGERGEGEGEKGQEEKKNSEYSPKNNQSERYSDKNSMDTKKQIEKIPRNEQKQKSHRQERPFKASILSQSQKLKRSQLKQQQNILPFVQSAKSVELNKGKIVKKRTPPIPVQQKQFSRISSSGQSAKKIDFEWKPIYVFNSQKQIKDVESNQVREQMSTSYEKIIRNNEKQKTNQIKKEIKATLIKDQKSEVIKKGSLPQISYSPSLAGKMKGAYEKQSENQQQETVINKNKNKNKEEVKIQSEHKESINKNNMFQIHEISSIELDTNSKEMVQSIKQKKQEEKISLFKKNTTKPENSKIQIQLYDSPMKIRINSPIEDSKNNLKQKNQDQQREKSLNDIQKKVPPVISIEQRDHKQITKSNKTHPKEQKIIKKKQFPPFLTKESKQQKEVKQQTISIRFQDKSNFQDSKPPEMVNLELSLSQEQQKLHQELQQAEPIGNSYILNQLNQKSQTQKHRSQKNPNTSGNHSKINHKINRVDRSAELAGVEGKYVQLIYEKLQRLNNDSDVLDFYELYQRYKQAMKCLQKSQQVCRLHQIRYQRFIEQIMIQKQIDEQYNMEQQLFYLVRRVREQQVLLQQQKSQFENQVHRHIMDSQKNFKETLKVLRKEYIQANRANQNSNKFIF